MPSTQSKNLAIGIFVIVALSIIVYILLFLHPTVSDKGQILHVRFTNIDKISIGTRVLFAGHPVGEVTNIEEVENARTETKAPNGEVYIYQLTLAIDSGVIIYTTDTITPTTSGLLGEKAISILPEPPKNDQPLVRVTDQVLLAEPPSSVEDALRQVTQTVSQINKGLATLDEGKFWENVSDTAENIADITTAMNRPEVISDLFDNFQASTVGKLVTTDDLYLRMTSLFSKGETVMDDINHYGLLFNNNKNWQRLRARRINLLTELSTPCQFTNYFNDEVNEIATSIARVSEVLRASSFCTVWENACSESFEAVFADLLRRIDGLEQMTKLINQQIVDERDSCKPRCR